MDMPRVAVGIDAEVDELALEVHVGRRCGDACGETRGSVTFEDRHRRIS